MSRLIAFPTDTTYGIACSFYDSVGYEKIFQLKGREAGKPLAVIVDSYEDIIDMIEISKEQWNFLKQYPFPFTILGKPKCLPPFLDPVCYALLGIRVAESALEKDIRERLHFPLFLTSANRSGEPEATTREAVEVIFGQSIPILGERSGGKMPSNVFSFPDTSLELRFIRKNY